MNTIRELIHEIHRRSLWQVLGIFLAASWGVLQVVQGVTDSVGLPDWTPSMAFVLLILGLPVVLATAFVQEGMPGGGAHAGPVTEAVPTPADATGTPDAATPPSAAAEPTAGSAVNAVPSRGFLTWRNAILGGIGAFALLGLSLVAYFVMWSSGIGPVGNLVAQGVIEDGVRVVLADFDDETGEGLGEVVTEALRVDLTEAAVLDLADVSELTGALERMQVEHGTPLTAELALEVAVRDGLGAVIDGGVSPVGDGYLITATLRDVATGTALSTFRSSAAGPDELIQSIDKLSQDIRERSGESLRDIKRGEPLEQVTTSSLEALRLYTEADAVFGIDDARALEMLERAVELDPEFAMAWRKLAAGYFNVQSRRPEMPAAATRAYEHRDRLPPRERYLAEAFYYSQVEDDAGRSAEAYRALLEIDPDHPAALNNLGNVYTSVGDFRRGTEMYRRAIEGPRATVTAYGNLVLNLLAEGEYEAAAQALADLQEAYPDGANNAIAEFNVLLVSEATSQAADFAAARLRDPLLSGVDRSMAAQWLAKLAYRGGRFDDGRAYVARAVDVAEEVNPTLAANQAFVGAFYEAFMDGSEAERVLRALVEMPGFSSLVTDQKAIAAWAAVAAGRPGLAREVLDGVYGPLDVDLTWPRRVDILLRALEGELTDPLAEMETLREVEGCLGQYCWMFELAFAAELQGDVVEAIQRYEIATRATDAAWPVLGFNNVAAELRLAPLLEQAGETERAATLYRRLARRWAEGDATGSARARDFEARAAALEAAGD